MAKSGSFLLVTWDGGGNVPPTIVMAKRMIARGRGVRALGPASLAARFGAEGIDFRAHRSGDEWTGGNDIVWPNATDEQRMAYRAHLDPSAMRLPQNAHAAVFPHADVFIGHAGFSGIGAALTYGVPMVCVPLGRDQPANAAQIAEAGVGRTVAPAAVAPDLRAAVADILVDPSYRSAASSMADAIRAYGNGERAVDELEELL